MIRHQSIRDQRGRKINAHQNDLKLGVNQSRRFDRHVLN